MKLCGNASRLQLQRGSMSMVGLLDRITVERSTCGGKFFDCSSVPRSPHMYCNTVRAPGKRQLRGHCRVRARAYHELADNYGN